MNIIEKKIAVKDYLTKSNLPASDYVINPYVGCPHACKYCYASIHTVLFMSPIFPYITEWKEIIHSTKGFVKEYWFENLNLRGAYKKTILGYVGEHYPDLAQEYERIYIQKDNGYWHKLAAEMDEYCRKLGVEYTNYFYHEKLVKG